MKRFGLVFKYLKSCRIPQKTDETSIYRSLRQENWNDVVNQFPTGHQVAELGSDFTLSSSYPWYNAQIISSKLREETR